MTNCLAIVTDMIFASRISGTARKVGANCKIVTNLDALYQSLAADHPGMVIVDMHCDGLSPETAIRAVKSQCPSAHVVAFFSHVQTELLEQAKAAGADETLPRSAFVQRLEQLLIDAQGDPDRTSL